MNKENKLPSNHYKDGELIRYTPNYRGIQKVFLENWIYIPDLYAWA